MSTAPETPRPITYQDPENGCFGCSPHNPKGLGLRFEEGEDGVLVRYVAPEHLQGAPGVVHGGIQATLLDEAMCMTAYAKLGHPVVTGEMTVRYLAPLPTGCPVTVSGRIVERKGRSFIIEGVIRMGDTGDEMTRARGRFFPVTEGA